jgi:preprotein translocase subunit YajC
MRGFSARRPPPEPAAKRLVAAPGPNPAACPIALRPSRASQAWRAKSRSYPMLFISDAYAQGAPGAEPSWMPLAVITLMMVVFYFLLIRPQAKRQKESKAMIDALTKGDEVVTTGGVVGKITELSDQYLTIQVASVGDKPITLSVQRAAIQTLLPKGTMKSLT